MSRLAKALLALACLLLVASAINARRDGEPGREAPATKKRDQGAHVKRSDAGIPTQINGKAVSAYCQAAIAVSVSQPDATTDKPSAEYIDAVKDARDHAPALAREYWDVTYDFVLATSREQPFDTARQLKALDQLDAVAKDVKVRCKDALKRM